MNRLYQKVRDELNAYDAVKWFRSEDEHFIW
jgi:hypothetical protein